MKKIFGKISLLLLLCLVPSGFNCIMEEKVLDIVLTEEACVEFPEWHDTTTYTTPDTLDIADEIADILAENDVDRSEITRAMLVSVSYGVVEFEHIHDWELSGEITIERLDIADGPVPILDYSNLSVQASLGIMTPANLNSLGVDLLNRALQDFIDGTDPILILKVENDSVVPPPNSLDRMLFLWKACVVMHVIVEQSLEVPDPF